MRFSGRLQFVQNWFFPNTKYIIISPQRVLNVWWFFYHFVVQGSPYQILSSTRKNTQTHSVTVCERESVEEKGWSKKGEQKGLFCGSDIIWHYFYHNGKTNILWNTEKNALIQAQVFYKIQQVLISFYSIFSGIILRVVCSSNSIIFNKSNNVL